MSGMNGIVNEEWVGEIAGELICESIMQMSAIGLKRVPELPEQAEARHLYAVYGETVGAFNIRMQLRAEWPLLERLAGNMKGESLEDQLEIEEYAMEFFNIVCGRFVSELYHVTGESARFLPTVFETPGCVTALDGAESINHVKFISDNNETAVFSWISVSQGQI